ncbi:hypothetical protein EYF80_036222 [Liparis tanakae]|uniref:Uncharacterized protein n=1 Tax=Liparis tanakae TaxID=230148 RepID=A0A4Z2GJW9_9TELE|nr:hypothetical protein EYF80_036222 [Liparis tanakae]
MEKTSQKDLTLQFSGGTMSWEISPPWTQKMCFISPVKMSQTMTEKSTPPDTSERWVRWGGQPAEQNDTEWKAQSTELVNDPCRHGGQLVECFLETDGGRHLQLCTETQRGNLSLPAAVDSGCRGEVSGIPHRESLPAESPWISSLWKGSRRPKKNRVTGGQIRSWSTGRWIGGIQDGGSPNSAEKTFGLDLVWEGVVS